MDISISIRYYDMYIDSYPLDISILPEKMGSTRGIYPIMVRVTSGIYLHRYS